MSAIRNITVTIHLPGRLNETADALSRLCLSGDYKIKKEILQQAMHQLNFYPTLDAFAHRTMKQLERYCSLQQDRRAVAKNAFITPRTNEKLLLYPPIGKVPQTIQKLKWDKTIVALIMLDWCRFKFRAMLPTILNLVTMYPSNQVLERGLRMKYEEKLPSNQIEHVFISTQRRIIIQTIGK
ncbi:MAG: hypothetical protein EZS28_034774 [Streblomastix strix]|uniref:Uncharacterized protein n=1 Tax=Streblomastix strix TaxID=222440 RepID=A0A5J4UI86_9EUKA|nr:MAG: hypothetical protein EZS28_034774 [Streblomastix strix]